MRIRRRSAIVLASAAALGVGLIAFPASASAAPPVVPTCTFPDTTGSDSCATLRVDALTAPIGGTFEPVSLGFRVRSRFDPQTSEITSLELRFDENIKIDLAAIGAECPSSELTGKNIAAAWEQCGPGADGTPASEGNAFLSTGLTGTTGCANGCVSGIVSDVPLDGGAISCLMIFKGADNTHVTIYWRFPVISAETSCDNPATNNAGSATLLYTSTLSHLPTSSLYDWTLTVPNLQSSNPAVDDLYATLRRGVAFEAQCTNRIPTPFRMLGRWDYTDPVDATDLRGAAHLCPH